MPLTTLGCHLCFWSTSYRLEVPIAPTASGSINMLEQLIELRKPVYSLDYWFITKHVKGMINSQMKKYVWVKSWTNEVLSWSFGAGTGSSWNPLLLLLFFLFWRSYDIGMIDKGFPDVSDGKESTCNTGDLDSIPGLGRSPGGAHGNLLQYSCL